MARIIARFLTTGTVRVYNPATQTSVPVSFSYISSGTSYERADKEARRQVALAALKLPGATGYPIFDTVTTVATPASRDGYSRTTNEPRLKLEGWNVAKPSPVEGYRVKQRLAAEDLQRTLEHASKEAAHLEPGFSTSFLRSHLQRALSLLIDVEVNASCERAYLEATKGA